MPRAGRRIWNGARQDVLLGLDTFEDNSAQVQIISISKKTGLARARVSSIIAQLSAEKLVEVHEGSWRKVVEKEE